MTSVEECIYESNEEFQLLLKEFSSSEELEDKVRSLCRLSGYLRFLFFEILEEKVQNAVGGDLRTLICGIPVVILKGIELCSGTRGEVVCGVVADALDLALSVMRKLGVDESLIENANYMRAKFNEGATIDEDLLGMIKLFSEIFIKLIPMT